MSGPSAPATKVTPTEILLAIFRYLPPIHLAKCRLICTRWLHIVDDVFLNDNFWYKHCRHEFPTIYKSAMYKAKPGMTWRKIYRSLFLWSRMLSASEVVDEFASASNLSEEIRDFKVLREGLVAVHTRDGIHYYDVETLKRSPKHSSLVGNYTSYTENDSNIVYIDTRNDLIVVRKEVNPGREGKIVINNVQMFLLKDTLLYYVTLENEVFTLQLCTDNVHVESSKRFDEQVIALGYSDTLNILTYQRELYSLIDGTFKLQCNIKNFSNMLHVFWKYSLLERMDWRVYIQWMYILNHTLHQVLLKDMLIIYPYGDVFFVGTTWGVFRVYFKPFVNGQLDLCNSPPIKQYNFAERSDCPVLSMSPIFHVDVVETEDGHIVLVAMPKKIAVLYFKHAFKQSPTWPILLFKEVKAIQV